MSILGSIAGVTGITRYIGIGMAVALAITVAHDRRLEHLRAGYADQLGGITQTVEKLTGRKIKVASVSAEIITIHDEGQRYHRERDNARGVVETQSASIRDYEAETKRLKAISAEKGRLAEKLMADRNVWIAKAKAASTRLEKLSAEQELKECDNVLDSLFAAGF